MAFESDFAQILKKKMNFLSEKDENTLKNTDKNPFFQTESINFYTNPYTWKPRKTPVSYRKKKVKRVTSLKKTAPVLEIKTFNIEQLCEESRGLILSFISLGALINKSQFSSSQLKKEFRRLAKVYHPDTSTQVNSSESFQELHRLYSSICTQIL